MIALNNEDRVNAMLFVIPTTIECVKMFTDFNKEDEENYAKWQEFLNLRDKECPVVSDEIFNKYLKLVENYNNAIKACNDSICKKISFDIRSFVSNFFSIDFYSDKTQWYYINESCSRLQPRFYTKSHYTEDERLHITDD